MKKLLLILYIGSASFWLISLGSAQEWTDTFLPETNASAPSWIKPTPNAETSPSFASASYQIEPLEPEGALLIELLFTEIEGGFLRVSLKSGLNEEMLAQNLYDNINMFNKRSLLITYEQLKGGGTLIFQASQQALNVERIRFERLNTTTILSPEKKEVELINSLKTNYKLAELSGQELPVADDQWKGQVVTAPLTEKALRIENGISFEAELSALPDQARLECQLNGLPLSEALVLWVNGQRAGWVFPQIPDLNDLGFVKNDTGELSYKGWRKASSLIPARLLKVGVNTFQFSALSEDTKFESLAIKELNLQLGYPAVINPSALATPAIPSLVE